MDLMLRFATAAEGAAAMPWFRTAGGGWVTASHHHALDAFGTVFDGATPAPVPGWHCNLRLAATHPDRDAIVAALGPYAVLPATPARVWV